VFYNMFRPLLPSSGDSAVYGILKVDNFLPLIPYVVLLFEDGQVGRNML
jgi:hypothetical protein